MRQELLDCSPYSNDCINIFPIVIYPGSRTCSFLSNILTFRVYSHTYSYSLWSTYKNTCIVQHSLRGIFCFPVFFGFYYSLIVFQLPTNVPLIIRQDLSSEVGAMASNPLRMRTKMKISFPHHNRVFLLLTLRVEGDGGKAFPPLAFDERAASTAVSCTQLASPSSCWEHLLARAPGSCSDLNWWMK